MRIWQVFDRLVASQVAAKLGVVVFIGLLISCGSASVVSLAPKVQLINNSQTAPARDSKVSISWEGDRMDRSYELLGRIEIRNYGSKRPKKSNVLDSLSHWAAMVGADGIVGLHTYDFDLQYSGLLIRYVPETPKKDIKRLEFLAAIAPVQFSEDEKGWTKSLQSRLQQLAQAAMEGRGYYSRVFSGLYAGQAIDSLLLDRTHDNDTLLSAQTEYALDLYFEDQSSGDPPLVVVVIKARLFSMTRNKVVWENSASSSSKPHYVYIPAIGRSLIAGGIDKEGRLLAIEKVIPSLFASLPSARDLSSSEEEK